MTRRPRIIGTALAWALAMAATEPVRAEAPKASGTLEDQFRDPPPEARPRVWWHWLNGNITTDGIARDLAWMKRVGIAGAQTFDAAMQTPQVVDRRLPIFSPEWNEAMRFAASEAERQGLELAIAASPGWTETGGPWVPPADGMKKLVWSELDLEGSRPLAVNLPQPPALTGPYQSIPADPSGGLTLTGSGHKLPIAPSHYRDIAVLAWPLEAGDGRKPPPVRFVDGSGKTIDPAALLDWDLASAVELSRPRQGVPVLLAIYDRQTTVRSATLLVAGAAGRYSGGSMKPLLEASDDGLTWRPVSELPLSNVPTTVSFSPVSARQFRISFNKAEAGPVAGFAPPVPGLDMGALGRMLGGAGAAMLGNSVIRVADFRLSAEPRIDRAEAKAGFAIAEDYFAISGPAPDEPGIPAAKVIDLTSHLKPDGTLDWAPPRGRWRVVRLGWSLTGVVNHPASPEATGLEVDKYDGAAVRRYLEHYLGLYRTATGDDLIGKAGIRALLNDSIESGAANWTPAMLEKFRELRGYDPLPWLPALTGTIVGSRSDSDRFLFDWRRTLSDLIASEHYGTIARVARENGLVTYGEALEHLRPSFGDDMAMRSHADIPMAALWTFPRERGPQPNYLIDMKGAASVANIYGKRLVAAETMTSLLSPWAFGPRDLKRVVDQAFVSGINRPIIHTSVHSPSDARKPGLSLFIFGQYFNRHESWAELAKPWVDYLSRNALMLQQGKAVTDLAFYYGEEAPLTGLYSHQTPPNAPKVYGYDFVNADALLSVFSNDGEHLITSGGARYRALYLGGSSRQMSLAVLRKVAELVEAGATVIGQRPVGNPGLAGDPAEYARLLDRLWPGGSGAQVGKGRIIASDDPEAALAGIGVKPDFRYAGGTGAEILFNHRATANADSYFVVNRANRAETIEARFRVSGKAPELWHADTGTSEPASYRIEGSETVVPLTLGPEGAVHVVFRKPAMEAGRTTVRAEPAELSRIEGAWQVTFEAGRGAPASAEFDGLAPLDEHSDPAIRYFSGIATYSRDFRTPRGWHKGQPLWLDLGEAPEVAEVSINGKLAGSAWNAPWRIDIGKFARSGRNRLSIRVANLWVNRFVGDAQPDATKVTWTASPTYTAKAPLRRSGLIGPVRLLGEAPPE